ncbi:MAG: DUF721 domain-containing protein [bacterium]|nr:DUF721 domain-containing protein [bacterium]MDP3771385.1 DUF721 domain-containing protein [bacterium]
MALSSLRSLLGGAARRAGITRDLAITHALRACQEALREQFGDGYSKFAEPISLRADGALTIVCRSPAVAQTLRLREAALLARIRREAPSVTVSRLSLAPRSREDCQAPEDVAST